MKTIFWSNEVPLMSPPRSIRASGWGFFSSVSRWVSDVRPGVAMVSGWNGYLDFARSTKTKIDRGDVLGVAVYCSPHRRGGHLRADIPVEIGVPVVQVSDSISVMRIVRAWTEGYEKKAIASICVNGGFLEVVFCNFDLVKVPLSERPLSKLEPQQLETFVISKLGGHVDWELADITIGAEILREMSGG